MMGAKIKKAKSDWHEIRLRSDADEGELLVVGKGRRTYLWVGHDGNAQPLTFSGQQTLRKLAKVILKTIPERRK